MLKKIVVAITASSLALGAVGIFSPVEAVDVDVQLVHEHLDDEETYGRRDGGGVFERRRDRDDDCPSCRNNSSNQTSAAEVEDEEGCGCPAKPARRIKGWGR